MVGDTRLVAFDYGSQKWVLGEPARELRLQQIAADLAILTGPRAGEYLALVGHEPKDVPLRVRALEEEAELLAGRP